MGFWVDGNGLEVVENRVRCSSLSLSWFQLINLAIFLVMRAYPSKLGCRLSFLVTQGFPQKVNQLSDYDV